MNALMKENPQKYAEVYADKSGTIEEKEGNIYIYI